MKLGLSTYSLHGSLSSGAMTVLDVIDYTAELGGQHVEIVPLSYSLSDNPELTLQIVERARQQGIELSNYAIGANFLTDDPDAYEREIERVISEVDIAARLGVKLMRHDVASSPDVSIANFNRHLGRLADACRRVADHAANYGITTSVENHGFLIQHADRVQALIQAVDRPNYKTTLDVGNFVCADENPVAAVQKNLPFASMVHIKDFYLRPSHRNPGAGWFTSTSGVYLRGAIIGQGDLDMWKILHTIKASGYDGYISVEFEGMEDGMTGARIGMENVQRIWDEV
ncbi:sugar phosphate isomerase/epimerase family protein [Paenibacillus bovis]|uniref:Sugar phosphate isomerase n=1 Tax=Paenibacillus bovis TaxID=1616788 RepID=A0A172ZDV0_9BACL|nr:sugar phosphate isomerase/epimerase family protein [Paenibacillus bovis]ANF95834.1 sugar phosphate isomerase [Paenibacillus bovis]